MADLSSLNINFENSYILFQRGDELRRCSLDLFKDFLVVRTLEEGSLMRLNDALDAAIENIKSISAEFIAEHSPLSVLNRKFEQRSVTNTLSTDYKYIDATTIANAIDTGEYVRIDAFESAVDNTLISAENKFADIESDTGDWIG